MNVQQNIIISLCIYCVILFLDSHNKNHAWGRKTSIRFIANTLNDDLQIKIAKFEDSESKTAAIKGVNVSTRKYFFR